MAFDPRLLVYITKAAKATGADPAALAATAMQESGGSFGRIGDNGTSYGPFQFHRGGALGSHDPAWANSYEAVLNRAQEFARLGVHGGKGAAAVQRPADASGYATSVDGLLGQARQLVNGGGGAAPTTSRGATPPRTAVTSPAAVGTKQQGALRGIKLPGGDPITSQRSGLLGYLLGQNAAFAGSTVPLTGALPQLAANGQQGMSPLLSQSPVKIKAAPQLRDVFTQKPPQPQLNDGATAPGSPRQASGEGVAQSSVVKAAMASLGTPYKWGGNDPKKGIDCSGLLQQAYAEQGVHIPRVTYDQWKAGTPVSQGELKSGDAVFFHPGARGPEHVGIYIGNDQFIEAPRTGLNVRISTLSGRTDYMGARRY